MQKVPNDENPPKYNPCSDDREFSFLGNGVYFYLFYIKFLVFMCFVVLGISSAVELHLSRKFNNELEYYCKIANLTKTINSNETCSKFNNATNNWLYSMNFENISKFSILFYFLGLYMDLVNNFTLTDNIEISAKEEVNINLIHFIAVVILFLVLCIFIVVVNNVDNELRFKYISPMTYALLISDISKDFESIDELKEKLNRDDCSVLDINLSFKFSIFLELKNEYKKLKEKFKEMQEADVSFISVNY
jgi:hypothetical protein